MSMDQARAFDWGFQTHGDPGIEKHFAAVGRYAGSLPSRRWLTIVGDPGCGKTHLAKKLARFWHRCHLTTWKKVEIDGELRERCETRSGEFRSWSRVLSQVLDRDKPDPIPEMERAGLLVIDDIGQESESKREMSRELLTGIMDVRDRAGRPIVFTTNRTPEQIIRWDQRIYSRLNRNGEIFVADAGDYCLTHSTEPAEGHRATATEPEPCDIGQHVFSNPEIADAARRIADKFKL